MLTDFRLSMDIIDVIIGQSEHSKVVNHHTPTTMKTPKWKNTDNHQGITHNKTKTKTKINKLSATKKLENVGLQKPKNLRIQRFCPKTF